MVVAINYMRQDKAKYLPPFVQQNGENKEPDKQPPALQISGNKADLVSFSVTPGQKVSGKLDVTGSVKNNYFFEGNIGVDILDANKKLLKQGHGDSTTEWMTAGPVSFKATLDFTSLPKGPSFIQIRNDNPSGLPENDKFIWIPIVIE